MLVQAIINLIAKTESGISKSTGNQWMSKYIVIEVEEENGRKNTMALQTMNHDIIGEIDKMMEGDKVEVDIGITARSRSFSRKDGSEGINRFNDAFIRSIKGIEVTGF